jgi:hypothetical protein
LCRILETGFSANDFDGLDLRVRLLPEDLNQLDHRPRVLTSAEVPGFKWSKPESPWWRDNWPTWNMTLDLVTSTNRYRGSLTLYRPYTDAAILVDINLLIADFPVVLADALERIFSTAHVKRSPEAEASTDTLSA